MTAALLLSEVAEINPRADLVGLRPVDEVDFFPMAAVDAEKTIASAEEKRPLQEVSKGFTCFKDGDVLLAKITPCFENGKISQASVRTSVAFGSTEFHVVRCGEDLDSRYLVHFLRRQDVRVDGERKMTGSGGQRRVPKHFLESLEIPLPTLSEQRRIAAILDKADALRVKRREALAQLDGLAQSIFAEMFGDGSGGHADVVELGGVTELITKGTTPTTLGMEFADSGIPFIRVQNLIHGVVDWNSDVLFVDEGVHEKLARSRIVPGDVLLSIAGTIGRSAVVPESAPTMNCNQAVALIRVKDQEVDPKFLSVWLRSQHAQRQIRGAMVTGTITNLSLSQIRSLKLSLPPMEKQREFVRILSVISVQKHLLTVAINEQDALMSSLQVSAFRGPH